MSLRTLLLARSGLTSEVAPPSVGSEADKGECGDLLSAPWRPLLARCSVPRESNGPWGGRRPGSA